MTVQKEKAGMIMLFRVDETWTVFIYCRRFRKSCKQQGFSFLQNMKKARLRQGFGKVGPL